MTATVLLTCNAANEYGTCPAKFTFPTDSKTVTREKATTYGWSVHEDKDYCPFHTKRGPIYGWTL